jgi:hypothetical protein
MVVYHNVPTKSVLMRERMGDALWGALLPAVAWAHHGLGDASDAAGAPWFVVLLPLLVFGGSFAVVWLVAVWRARRQKPRVSAPRARRKG